MRMDGAGIEKDGGGSQKKALVASPQPSGSYWEWQIQVWGLPPFPLISAYLVTNVACGRSEACLGDVCVSADTPLLACAPQKS